MLGEGILAHRLIKHVCCSQYVSVVVAPHLVVSRFYEFAIIASSDDELIVYPCALEDDCVDAGVLVAAVFVGMRRWGFPAPKVYAEPLECRIIQFVGVYGP
jgi:hypothetical protein